MRFTEKELAEYQQRQSAATFVPDQPKKQSKYRNQKVTIDGITFDSKREGERYRQLSMLESAGKIQYLTLQPVYELAPAVTIQGKKKQALRYVADFRYIENGKTVVEDVKGMKTDIYIIKRHLMKHLHGIDILET